MPNREKSMHTLSVLVEDVDGIMSRVSGMFTRRGYSMHSINSAKTEVPGFNRITVVVWADAVHIEQITKQLNKLINVIKVVRFEEESSIARGYLMVKVSTDTSNRPQVVDAAKLFRARVIDVARDSVIIEATGGEAKLKALLDVLEPFGILELIQCGQIVLGRGPRTMMPPSLRPQS
ncbi:acetolactate synthase small subunit [uncultured Corynebacterium sp.]|uniref:acetolactate synthase small subunit n=1 Tax=uncultured Corynebacterium sp. TaxID=159447 RepID=UPI002615D391|nr:acetolactate synthase small subunit [uncultured Corynebacterium sp.]